MIIHTIDPVFINIGPFAIRYYGLVYAIGIIGVYLYMRAQIRAKKTNLTYTNLVDVILYGAIGMLLGGRLGYVFIYNLEYFLSNPGEIFQIWHGGMSFHGALIGVILAIFLYAKYKKISLYTITDALVIPCAFFLFLGRIANFINGELYGTITDVPWGVVFPNQAEARHPSQLYAAGKNLLIGGVLLYLFKKQKLKSGTLSWLFVLLYGTLRFLIGFVRVPDGVFLYLGTGQWLSLSMVFISIIVLYRRHNS